MSGSLANILPEGVEHLNIVLVIGIAILGGTVGAILIQLLRIPRIIGYIAIGIILGPVLKIISPDAIECLNRSTSLRWV